MKLASEARSLVLGVHPNVRGFGWAVLESPVGLYGFATYTARKDKNRRCLAKFKWLLSHYQPDVLVLETFDRDTSQRSERIRRLCTDMVALAAEHGSELAVYRRGEVADAFAGVEAHTRQAVAESVARQLPALQPHLPEPRKAWSTEDTRLAVFNAAALALTHFRNGATALLDEMRDAA